MAMSKNPRLMSFSTLARHALNRNDGPLETPIRRSKAISPICRSTANEEIFVPNIVVKVPQGAFDAAGCERLAKGITAVAKTVEQIGDDPRQELTAWVVIEEIRDGHFFAGGRDAVSRVLPVIVFFHAPAGVIGEAGRVEAVRLVHAAVAAAKSDADPRPVVTSVIVSEVADGTWGVNGVLWRCGDFAKAAGYKHLQHLAASTA
jgi:phenylpyruvate tautomerase PptA (4-oxalocrotonate tautomerase family)